MRLAAPIIGGLLMLASDALVTEHQPQLALQCLFSRDEFLTSMNLLCHYNCPGRGASIVVKIPNRCPLFINV
jgi:hypothetical protein